jgi:phenylalanyl-tRNA synthetase beta chain
MRVSYRWLCELLPALSATPAEVAERLTTAGLEVEAVQAFGAGLERVLVAAVREVEQHPERSGLRLVTVDRGGQQQRVVCGAPNVPGPGGLVVLAPVGTTLPAVGVTLTPRDIGGVVSEGMLCSEAELGLGDGADGILVLPEGTAEPGTPLPDALPGAQDTLFELGVTPNRPDALGHVGVARELGMLFGLDFTPPEPAAPARTAEAELGSLISVDNEDTERCPHYGAGVVLDVQIAPSPLWLRWRLYSLGVRPISNVVDITNLILLEYGQPMHAFDLDRVRQSRIVVRRARAGEPFTTLDGVARKLVEDDLVICDGEGPSALAGVMGGEDSEIRDETRRVLLECAYFTPRGIRRTSRRHALHTESSFRFERGVDWGAVPRVLEHAKSLLTELCSGAAVPGALHAKGPAPAIPQATLRSGRLDALVGKPIDFDEALGILRRLGFGVGSVQGQGAAASADVVGASWRPDISREVDLIEEVARVHGLDRIPTVLPAIAPQTPRSSGRLERDISAHAVSLGLSEAITFAFVSPRELEAVHAPPPVVRLSYPLTEERSVMRTSLLPGLLEALGRARRRGQPDARLFAVGARFLPPSDAPRSAAAEAARPKLEGDARELPEERPSFAALLAGTRPAYLTAHPDEYDVYDAKGLALELVERMTRQSASVEHSVGEHALHLHPRGAAVLRVGGTTVGVLGPLHPDVVDALDLGGGAQIVELDLAALEAVGRAVPRFAPIPRLPAVSRDLALVVHDDVPAGRVEALIRGAAGGLCESVELFDLFRGGSVPEQHRSLAFHVVYRDPGAATDPDHARTLTDKEVDARQAEVIRAAEKELGASLRS